MVSRVVVLLGLLASSLASVNVPDNLRIKLKVANIAAGAEGDMFGAKAKVAALIKQISRDDPDLYSCYLLDCDLAGREGDVQGAQAACDEAVSLNPRIAASADGFMGKAHLRAGNANQAVELLQKSIGDSKKRVHIELFLAQALELRGIQQRSRSDLEAARDKFVDFVDNERNYDASAQYRDFALLLTRLGQDQEAEDWLRRSLELWDHDIDTTIRLVNSLKWQGKHEEATEVLLKAIEDKIGWPSVKQYPFAFDKNIDSSVAVAERAHLPRSLQVLLASLESQSQRILAEANTAVYTFVPHTHSAPILANSKDSWMHSIVQCDGHDSVDATCSAVNGFMDDMVTAMTNKETNLLCVDSVQFMKLGSGTQVRPHCADDNHHWTVHVGLGGAGGGVVVSEEALGWEAGRAHVFDASYEHTMAQDDGAESVVLVLEIDRRRGPCRGVLAKRKRDIAHRNKHTKSEL